MKIRTDFPHKVKFIENAWIPMPDGVKLAANIWMPEGTFDRELPAIIEYLPYRKDDFTAIRDDMHHSYFAGFGYVSIRVDMRGSGNSEGILNGEYLEEELSDGEEILKWLDQQPWFSGNAGMIGLSWGGFNGLQIAARNPKQLKAIITVCSTDDRYNNDVHYMGGAVVASEMLTWASRMIQNNALPPNPRHVSDWKSNWTERLEKTPFFVEEWLSHQNRDDFWKHGSVIEDYSKIECAVYAVGGWHDPYVGTIFRLLSNLNSPKKGLIGPWAHTYPNFGRPGPAINFLQESVKWFDKHLKGIETEIMADALTVWMQDSLKVEGQHKEREGEFISLEGWPPEEQSWQTLFLSKNTLTDFEGEGDTATVHSNQTTGFSSAAWCPYGYEADFAGNQTEDLEGTLSFSTHTLTNTVNLLGFPKIALELKSAQEVASVAVRLSDVFPDGSSTLMSYGVLNLSRHKNQEKGEAVPTDQTLQYEIELVPIGYKVAKGHKIRIDISPSYWPILWPPVRPVTLNVICGKNSYINLPMLNEENPKIKKFDGPEEPQQLKLEYLRKPHRERINKFKGGDVVQEYIQDHGQVKIVRDNVLIDYHNMNTFKINAVDPLTAKVESTRSVDLETPYLTSGLKIESSMSADESYFYVDNHLKVTLGGELFFEKRRNKKIKRDFM